MPDPFSPDRFKHLPRYYRQPQKRRATILGVYTHLSQQIDWNSQKVLRIEGQEVGSKYREPGKRRLGETSKTLEIGPEVACKQHCQGPYGLSKPTPAARELQHGLNICWHLPHASS
ncbi:hypothetical protein M3J09_000157 [Ascochyta lentis]